MPGRIQDQKEREAQRQKELDELFAEAIKQPKVPVGAPGVASEARTDVQRYLAPGIVTYQR